jgi:hypothetical protein
MNNVLKFTHPNTKEEPDFVEEPIHQEELKRPLPIQLLAQDVESHMGKGFSDTLPREIFESFCLRTIERNEPTGLMLAVLVSNFMKAYADPDPEIAEKAMEAFDYLTYLALDDKSVIDDSDQ